MNILVLTSSMIDEDFASFQNEAVFKPNPSNQIFYSKLIKALAVKNTVHVVSLRPFVSGMLTVKSLKEEKKTVGNINYYYSHTQSDKVYKLFNEVNDVVKTAKLAINDFPTKDFIIVTDTLRYHLLLTANKLKKLFKVKTIGMLTDNPENISGFDKKYIALLSKQTKKLDGYLTLTKKLVENIDKTKPFFEFDGLIQEEFVKKVDPISNYFFFAGSLYEKYGVKRLIDAYRGSNCKTNLLICGNGPLGKYIEKITSEEERILYLPQISHDKVIAYELNSIANINPRPLNEKIDEESVPSKLIEYLSIDKPIISTKFPKIYNKFKDNINWIEDDSVLGILETLENFETLNYTELNKKASITKSKAFNMYDLKVQGKAISEFLNSLYQ